MYDEMSEVGWQWVFRNYYGNDWKGSMEANCLLVIFDQALTLDLWFSPIYSIQYSRCIDVKLDRFQLHKQGMFWKTRLFLAACIETHLGSQRDITVEIKHVFFASPIAIVHLTVPTPEIERFLLTSHSIRFRRVLAVLFFGV